MPTETIIRTLKEAKQDNPKHILPRTVLKAVADENGDFVSSDVTAQDINQLHGKTLVTANAQTLTAAQKAQARENIDAFALTYDDSLEVIKITNQGETLGDVRTILNSVNNAGRHVMFDVSVLGAAMYLCTIFIDDNSYTIFDAVSGRFSNGAYDSTKLLTICLANANHVATQSQIDNLQEQIDELGGREVIKDLETLGNLILSGDSPNVISLGDKIDFNFIKTVIGSTTHGNAVSCSDVALFMNGVDEAEASTYYFVYDGTNWTYKEAAIDLADFGLTVSGTVQTGEVMTVNTTIETENFTFTSYDTAVPESENVPHTWTMEATYAPTTKVYDTYEALFTLAAGKTLPAGNYKMIAPYYGSSPMITVYFTIPTDFTATGKKLQFASTGYQNVACIPGSETKYYIASAVRPAYIDSNVYEAAAITVKYNQDGEWTDISTIDGVTCNPCHIQPALGDNCPAYCNLRQWLNDDSKGGNYHATEEFDRPSSYNFTEGYLHRLDPRVRRLIVPSKNKFTAGYQNGEYTQGQTYEVVDEVFLLSMKEMSFNVQTAEGTATGLYSAYTNNVLTNDAVPARAKYNKAGGTLNSYRWSRSASSSYANSARYVTSSGSLAGSNVFYGYYVAPALNIGKSTQS